VRQRCHISTEFLDDLDIGNQTARAKDSLEEIVTEQRAVGYTTGESGLKGIHIVDALPAYEPRREILGRTSARRKGIYDVDAFEALSPVVYPTARCSVTISSRESLRARVWFPMSRSSRISVEI